VEKGLIGEAIAGDVTKLPKKKKPAKGKKEEPLKSQHRLVDYLKLMEAENLDELEISEGSEQIKLVRESKGPAVQIHRMPAHPQEPSSKEEAPDGLVIKAPLGGIFYRSSSPKSPPFVKEGDTVTPGQTLCIVEAMKVMNEIKAEVTGRVSKIFVENGRSIESEQPLFIIKLA